MVHTITTTERLFVRPFVYEDAAFLHDLHSRPEVFVPLGMEPSSDPAEELRRIQRFGDRFGGAGDFGIWAPEAVPVAPIVRRAASAVPT